MTTDGEDQQICDRIMALGKNFLAQGKYDSALTIFDGVMAINPSDIAPVLLYGEALLMAERFEAAFGHFVDLQKQFGLDERLLLGAAKAGLSLNKCQEVRELLKPILDSEIPASLTAMRIARNMWRTPGD